MTCYRTHICCTANREPEVEALLERVVPAIGADVLALGIPELAGVCLGGGYGRGEGGPRGPGAVSCALQGVKKKSSPRRDCCLAVFWCGDRNIMGRMLTLLGW